MSFEPSKTDAFLEIFNASKTKIAAFEGCRSVELLQDYDSDNIFYTYSVWDSNADLENYRHSELFKGVWTRTRALFNDKPKAYSLKKHE